MQVKMSESEFLMLDNENCGVCQNCGAINDSFHEPDAMNYHCDECDRASSIGASNALVMGLIEIVDEDQGVF